MWSLLNGFSFWSSLLAALRRKQPFLQQHHCLSSLWALPRCARRVVSPHTKPLNFRASFSIGKKSVTCGRAIVLDVFEQHKNYTQGLHIQHHWVNSASAWFCSTKLMNASCLCASHIFQKRVLSDILSILQPKEDTSAGQLHLFRVAKFLSWSATIPHILTVAVALCLVILQVWCQVNIPRLRPRSIQFLLICQKHCEFPQGSTVVELNQI